MWNEHSSGLFSAISGPERESNCRIGRLFGAIPPARPTQDPLSPPAVLHTVPHSRSRTRLPSYIPKPRSAKGTTRVPNDTPPQPGPSPQSGQNPQPNPQPDP